MRSDTTQLDILRDDQQRIVGAWMAAAATALLDAVCPMPKADRAEMIYLAMRAAAAAQSNREGV